MKRRRRDEQGAFVSRHEPGKPRVDPFEDDLYLIDEPEFVLIPLLATDPLPYLVDIAGNRVNAKGKDLKSAEADQLSAAASSLQDEVIRGIGAGKSGRCRGRGGRPAR